MFFSLCVWPLCYHNTLPTEIQKHNIYFSSFQTSLWNSQFVFCFWGTKVLDLAAGKCVIAKLNETRINDRTHLSHTTPFSMQLFIIVQNPCGSHLKHTHTLKKPRLLTLWPRRVGLSWLQTDSKGCADSVRWGIETHPPFLVLKWTLGPSNTNDPKLLV